MDSMYTCQHPITSATVISQPLLAQKKLVISKKVVPHDFIKRLINNPPLQNDWKIVVSQLFFSKYHSHHSV